MVVMPEADRQPDTDTGPVELGGEYGVSTLAVAQSIRTLFPADPSVRETPEQFERRLSSADLSREEREALLALHQRMQRDPAWLSAAKDSIKRMTILDAWI